MKNCTNWKKAIALLLTLTLVIAVTGCASTPATTESSLSSDESSVPTPTQEELDALQAEKDNLQKELDELKSAQEASSSVLAEIEPAVDTDVPSEADLNIIPQASSSQVPLASSAPAATTTVTAVAFAKSSDLTLNVGNTNRRTATTTPAGTAVTYTSSNPKVATVAKDGNVTCLVAGKTIITATAGGKSASYNLTVATKTTAASSTATSSQAASQPSSSSTAAASGTGVFAGYKVTVNDKTTLATTGNGNNGFTVYTFQSSSGASLGSISGDDMLKIMKKYQSSGDCPYDMDGYKAWFAKQFNSYRGLNSGADGSNNSSSSAAETEPVSSNELIRLVNQKRVDAGLNELEVDSELVDLAKTRAKEVMKKGGHTRPDGTTVVDLGYGENLHSGSTTASGAVSSWMNSSGHKENLLLEKYKYAGAAYYNVNGNICWVIIFSA